MTNREAATILAALRLFQDAREDEQRSFPHFDDVPPLFWEQINHLCEEINCSPALARLRLTGIR